jgi:fibronectin type 3 domain-containing protein
LGGASSASTVANGSGAYTFSGLANGAYTVTPTNTGYTFSPTEQNVTVSGSNVGNINFTATATQAHSVSLSWTASTTAVTGYNVYRGTVNGGPYTLVNTGGLITTGVTFTDNSVQNGVTYYYVATAVDGSGESAYSNQATANVP